VHQISTNLTRLLTTAVVAAGVLLAAVLVPAADAAVPKTGTWRGDLVHQLSATSVPYETTIVITAYQGRIKTVVATVRMECGSSDPLNSYGYGVRDVRVLESWSSGRGPKVRKNGAFAFRADGAYFQGRLSKSSAIGGASATYGEDCHGTGRFNAQRGH
jgi:hypothetical protein